MDDATAPTSAESELLELLAYYRQAGEADHEAWQDRPMEWNGHDGNQLSRLHGELIAAGWLELNLDSSQSRKETAVASCYRVTREGYRLGA